MRTMDDFDFSGKKTIIRVDFNSPVDEATRKILDSSRIKAHTETLRELALKGARTIILAHQGRKGTKDFISLKAHTEILKELLPDIPIYFVDETFGSKAKEAVNTLKDGEILVLENTRFQDSEAITKTPDEHASTPMAQALAAYGDIFVNDGFSVAHRSHLSTVGLTKLLPSCAGRVMEKEVLNLEKVTSTPEKPCIYVLGGIKPEDSFKVAKFVLERDIADKVLTGGVISMIVLIARGIDLGEPSLNLLKENDLQQFIETAKSLDERFLERIITQEDVAVDKNGRFEADITELPLDFQVKDIGKKTIENYTRIIHDAKSIVLNGPMGVFEEDNFSLGTLEVFKAVVDSQAFAVSGGGHTLAFVEQFHIKFSYVSTGGGAMIRFLTGKKLPVLEALNKT